MQMRLQRRILQKELSQQSEKTSVPEILMCFSSGIVGPLLKGTLAGIDSCVNFFVPYFGVCACVKFVVKCALVPLHFHHL